MPISKALDATLQPNQHSSTTTTASTIKPSPSILALAGNTWSCCYCGKGSLEYHEAVQCEQSALEDFKMFPDLLARSIVRSLSNRSYPMEATVDTLWTFLSNHFCTGEHVNVEISGAKYLSVVEHAEWPCYEVSFSMDGKERQILSCTSESLSRPLRHGWSKRHLRIFLRIVMYPKHGQSDSFRVRDEYLPLLQLQDGGKDVESFAMEMSQYLTRNVAVGKKSTGGGQQRLEAFFDPHDVFQNASQVSTSSTVPISIPIKSGSIKSSQLGPQNLPEWDIAKGTNSWDSRVTNELIFVWNFIMSFGGAELNIFPFRLQEFEAALLDTSISSDFEVTLRNPPAMPISNEILFVSHRKLIRALARERQENGKQALVDIYQRLAIADKFSYLLDSKDNILNSYPIITEDAGTVDENTNSNTNTLTPTSASIFSSFDLYWPCDEEDEKKQKIRWYSDKFDQSNWNLMVVSLFLDILPPNQPPLFLKLLSLLYKDSEKYPLLATSQKLFILKMLVEMVFSLSVCRKALDSFTEKVIEARKNKRIAEAECKKLKKDLENIEKEKSSFVERSFAQDASRQPLTERAMKLERKKETSQSERKFNKDIKELSNKIEYQERSIKHCDNEISKWNCVRVAPVGRDRDGRSYWIFDYWGPNVEAGDCGRLYVNTRSGQWFFYDTIEQLDQLISALQERRGPHGKDEKSLLDAISTFYYEHLCTSFKKYYNPPIQSQSPESPTLSDSTVQSQDGQSSPPSHQSSSASASASTSTSVAIIRKGGRRNLIDPQVTFLKYQNKWE